MMSFDPGGTERQMIELVRRLDPSRWAVHVACFHMRGGWFSKAAEAATSIAEFPVRTFRTPAVLGHLRAFARWCRAKEFVVVHTTELYSNIFGLPGAALAGVPVRIGSRREINARKTAAQLAAQRAAYTLSHTVVANSRAAARRLRAECVPSRKIVVVPNGLDAGAFRPREGRSSLRKVVIVANLRPEKGHTVLIDAAPEVLRQFPDAQFEVVGGGGQLSSLISQARARGVHHAFTFLGHREDVGARLEAADIFVLPSRSEAFPNAVMEAMASGLPIVASGIHGIRELIENERTGLLVSVQDSPALAAQICRLMRDPSLAGRLGAAARARAESSYSFERMVASFESIYLARLAERGLIAPDLAGLAVS
jgi:glycosyltransferase involved in cell wall biosynthesis